MQMSFAPKAETEDKTFLPRDAL